MCVRLLTVISVLEGPAGDDVLHQHGVALHEDLLRHQADGRPLQRSDLHVHRTQLGGAMTRNIYICDSFVLPECQKGTVVAGRHILTPYHKLVGR